MKALLSVSLLALSLACAGSNRSSWSPAVHLIDPPQSAYSALVDALEIVDAIDESRAMIRIRAIECDSLVDREVQKEYVRIVLHVTVLSEHGEDARSVLEELRRALEAEGVSTTRQEAIAFDRVVRVFHGMDWVAEDVPRGLAFAGLVSYSEALRLEFSPGVDPNLPGIAEASLGDSEAMAAYIQRIAREEFSLDDAFSIDVTVFRPRPDIRDIRYRIRPSVAGQAFTKAQIGQFLFQIEAQSPGVTVTRIHVAPHEPGSDIDADAWTFEAQASVRVSDGFRD